MQSLPRILAIGLVASLTTLAVGCSSGTSQSTPSAATSQQQGEGSPTDQNATGGPGGGGMPGVNGLIADITDTTMQVQGQSGQTAVTWSDTTTFTQQAAGTASDVTVGVCVSGMQVEDGSVTRLSVTQATDGACSMGGGGGQPSGGRPSEMPSGAPDGGEPSDMPSGAPSGAPSGMPSGSPDGAGAGTMVSGLVKAVDGTSVTVTRSTPGSEESAETTLTVGSDTAITTTTDATAASAVVGACASARGEADGTGAVAATSITISEATDGECGGGAR